MSEKALGMVLVAEDGKLEGIFTDGDLRRTLESKMDFQKLTIQNVMTKDCKSIEPKESALKAIQMMEKYSLNSLPVVDSQTCHGLVTSPRRTVCQACAPVQTRVACIHLIVH